MPEDVDPKERIDGLLAERGAIAMSPNAKRRVAEIDDALKHAGYDGPLPGDEENTDAPKRRGRRPAAAAAEDEES